MIQINLNILVSNEKREDVLSIFRSVLEPTKVEPGCMSCFLCQDLLDEHRLRFTTEWRIREALDSYLRSVLYRSVLVAVDLAAEAPEINIHTISETHGLEYIAAVREGHSHVHISHNACAEQNCGGVKNTQED